MLVFILVQTKRYDLSAVNINRGRDHGLPSNFKQKQSNRILFSNLAYNAMRQYCGLSYALSFNDLTDSMDLSVIKRLASVYA